jgi:hypothetical protein
MSDSYNPLISMESTGITHEGFLTFIALWSHGALVTELSEPDGQVVAR